MCIRDRSKPINEVANRGLTGAEGVKKSTTAAFRDSVERIGRRRRAGHVDIICRYGYMSTQDAGTHKCPAVIHGNKRTGDGNPGRPLAPLRAGGDDPRNRCVSAWLRGRVHPCSRDIGAEHSELDPVPTPVPTNPSPSVDSCRRRSSGPAWRPYLTWD